MSTNNNTKPNTTIEEIDLIDLAIKILRKWYIFVILGILFVAIAIYYAFSTPSQYKTTGTVLIRAEQGMSALGIDASLASDFLDIGTAVDDEKIIFQSKTILSQLVTDLDLQTSTFYQKRLGGYYQLYENEPLIVIFPDNYKQTIKGSLQIDVKKTKKSTWKINFKHKWKYKVTKYKTEISDLSQPQTTPWGDFAFIEDITKIDPDYPNYKLRFITVSKKSRIDEYSQNISISISDKKANAIDISIEGGSIIKNEKIVNKIIELYDDNNLADKQKSTLETLKLIEERTNIVKQELDIIEYKVEQYRTKNNLADLTTQAEIIINSANVYEKTITNIEMEYTLVTFIENHILNSDTIKLIPNTGISSEALSGLIGAYNTRVMEYMRLSRSTNEDNPFVSQLMDKILLTRENILQTIASTKESIEIRRQDYIRRNAEMNEQLSSIPTVEREYIELVREQSIKRSIYVFLLQKYENVQTALASNTKISKIVDYAYTPERPISPRKMVSLFIAVFMAGLCGLIYIFLESILNTKILDKSQLSSLSKNTIIAYLPKTNEHIISQNSEDLLNQAFRSLRTALITNKTVLITQSKSESENINIALNTALSFTYIKKKVALVNVNKDHENGIGLANCLTNSQYKLEDIKKSYADNANLDLYPLGETNANISDILQTKEFENIIKQLQDKYDYIIINSTPSESDSFQILNKFTDITLFVCTKNITKKENIKYLESLVENNRINNVSIIMNGFSEKGM